MKRIIISIVALAVFCGCCPKLYPHKTESTEHMVVVTETIRDTVIQIRPDSSIVQALIMCDSTGRAMLIHRQYNVKSHTTFKMIIKRT